ncbi:pyridoxal phosphate-dependent aminotransferase [Nonomuraea jiangxiensis]|uniref:Aspartate/methionine/tyrosine aminotransferase n=1 Tax=Nonomuraea jiangxiensis TaxID=633440 RepID=A0A1G8EM73_9ACTN|nr:pyridoxal phosphate-dependent aminotransferase [Nonomuraea jiangxiensis]SDH71014.1 Aspartate/methionine/tyrosine aminotransferase [Nonomuraea jiangxiensis]
MRLFETVHPACPPTPPAPAPATAGPDGFADGFVPTVDERMLDVYSRARNPEDPLELRDLWLGRVECELGPRAHRPALARLWRTATPLRVVEPAEVLGSRATVRFVKELFNWFFRDDLYGDLRSQATHILSAGSIDEQAWGLPQTLKDCLRHALDLDWYGYSDSRGRRPVREAVAGYENARMEAAAYRAENVAITMGGTFAVSSLADFILHGAPATGSPALCAIPNYPPLVETVARRSQVRLVPLPSRDGQTSLRPLIDALSPDTPMVLLQTVGNPTGAAVVEAELAKLVRAASPSTMIVLDECHEWLGPPAPCSADRAAPNVIRVSSLSKTWSAPGMKVGWLLAEEQFVADYYEYASTTFGGPPSFFYTLVEVLARMERWLLTGLDEPTAAELAEFEPAYGLRLDTLSAAYRSYRAERLARDTGLRTLRSTASHGLAQVPVRVLEPHYSINTMVEFTGWDDSYRCFRDLLHHCGVSVFPGILTFCFAGGIARITSSRREQDLLAALDRLESAFALTPDG